MVAQSAFIHHIFLFKFQNIERDIEILREVCLKVKQKYSGRSWQSDFSFFRGDILKHSKAHESLYTQISEDRNKQQGLSVFLASSAFAPVPIPGQSYFWLKSHLKSQKMLMDIWSILPVSCILLCSSSDSLWFRFPLIWVVASVWFGVYVPTPERKLPYISMVYKIKAWMKHLPIFLLLILQSSVVGIF